MMIYHKMPASSWWVTRAKISQNGGNTEQTASSAHHLSLITIFFWLFWGGHKRKSARIINHDEKGKIQPRAVIFLKEFSNRIVFNPTKNDKNLMMQESHLISTTLQSIANNRKNRKEFFPRRRALKKCEKGRKRLRDVRHKTMPDNQNNIILFLHNNR